MSNKFKRIVLCLDGTWNNPYQKSERDDGSEVLKPGNTLKMARAVLPWDENEKAQQIVYYDSGVGALGTYPGLSNMIVGFVDNKLGGSYGAGFEANIEQAVTFLINNYSHGDQIYLFGFSRGAAQARGLTQFLSWMGGLPKKQDAYYLPIFFREYLRLNGKSLQNQSDFSSFSDFKGDLQPIKIELLAVWDTVMALGARFKAVKNTSTIEKSFHVEDRPASCVKNARQALAIDEQRYDFRPEIWKDCEQHQTLEQRWFSGVHTNIGGGYDKDGLANITFKWFLKEAQNLGLTTNNDFTKFYRGFPQDYLYDSRNLLFSITEALRFKRGKGIRTLLNHPKTANINLDKSVITRLCSKPKEQGFDRMELYRPTNVLEYLRSMDDQLGQYLSDLYVEPDDISYISKLLENRH